MKAILLTMLLGAQAFAGIQLKFELKSDYVDGFGKINITPLSKGRLQIAHDDNACFGEPHNMLCTKKAVRLEVVDPILIKDNRPVDGDLIVKLNDKLHLSIGSGFNLQNKIFAHVIDTQTGAYVEVYPIITDAILK